MSTVKKILQAILLCLIIFTLSLPTHTITSKASSSISFIVLSQYSATVDIGNEFYLLAVTSNGQLPTFKSSDSKIASVNTYGKVTPKKSGTTTITAKIKNAEASCKVTVNKTKVSIQKIDTSMERNETLKLSATTSNGSIVTWKSSKKSVATIDENGLVTGIKPGETTITASADGTKTTCKIIVKSPSIKLNKTKITLYRTQTEKLSATVSSGVSPTWKTNKKSVAIIDETGTITAIKHGTATITATVDGISKTCEVLVKQPVITLSHTELSMKKGDTKTITATVSSNNPVIWSSSNPNVVTISEQGVITGISKGKAYIYASEDGIKTRCIIYVTE